MSLISVIIPCYNYGWLLSETLDSLLAQTHVQWECLIIDDGSTDTSRAVGESYQKRDARFRYVYQTNKGMSAARNHGLRLAQGEYIQFLDADDLLAPAKLATQSAYLDAHTDVDVIYGDVRYFHHGVPEVFSRSFDMQDTPWMVGAQGSGEQLLSVLMEKNIMVTPAPLFRVALLKEVGMFAEYLRGMEDWEYWVRCVLEGATFQYNDSPACWALVRVHQTSTNQNTTKMHKYEVIARQRLQHLLEERQATNAMVLNQTGLHNILETIAEQARQKILVGNRRAGSTDYLYLARATGRYGHYAKTWLYWLKYALWTG